MNKIAILPLKETKSCKTCELCNGIGNSYNCDETVDCGYLGVIWEKDFINLIHHNCPLIAIDIDELEEAVNEIQSMFNGIRADLDKTYLFYKKMKTIKSTIDKLGGKQ